MSELTIFGLGIMGFVFYACLMFAAADLSERFIGSAELGPAIVMFLTGAVLAYVGTLK